MTAPVRDLPDPADVAPFVMAIAATRIFADPDYQRDLDTTGREKDFTPFNPRLLGILEVSDRGDGTYAVIDGQHRVAFALANTTDPGALHLVCNVHTGLSRQDEARMFADIDRQRRRLTWWDLWRARRGAGDTDVLRIDALLGQHGLRVDPAPRAGHVRAVAILERVVAMKDIGLLDSTLAVLTSAYGHAFDAFRAELVEAVALIADHYDIEAELDLDRLVVALQDIPPRQLSARAAALEDAVKGNKARRVAMIVIQLYNARPGRNVADFLVRVPSHTKTGQAGRDARKRKAIEQWAGENGWRVKAEHRIPAPVLAAYEKAHAPTPSARPVTIVPVRPTPAPPIATDARLCSEDDCHHPKARHRGFGGCTQPGCFCIGFEAAE